MDNMYRIDNPDLPTLQPWTCTTRPPADALRLRAQPVFPPRRRGGAAASLYRPRHRRIADGKLIPAKAGAGDADLQARYLRFDNYTFLKQGEKRNGYQHAALGDGARLAARALSQPQRQRPGVADADCATCASAARCRSASTGTRSTRRFYFGLGSEGNNTVLAAEPAVRAGVPRRVDDVRPPRPTRCSTRSA